ncbi:hypothetical protein AVEN_783-1 [Araneus ventricosus]|uniref:Uncharacterized protein n=1 Tax=Araneus ventricosus TaxID=182803 RepID=A0A4Y2H2D2_ARAVE|nr:hypothetical protein AVEN_783-1 [Araneus ventricosus]
MTPRYAIKGRLPPPSSISERNRKNASLLSILYGKTFTGSSSPNHCAVSDNFYFIRKHKTSKYVIKGHLSPKPSIFEIYRKTKFWQSPSAATATNLSIFISYGSLKRLNMSSRVTCLLHPPFSRCIAKPNFGRVPQPLQPPIRQFISPSCEHSHRPLILRRNIWQLKAAS